MPATPKTRTLLAAAAVASACSIAGGAQTHPSLPGFLASIQGNFDLEAFNGATDLQVPAPTFSTPNGYVFTVTGSPTPTVFRHPLGMGATSSLNTTRINFTGRPVSAVSATIRVGNSSLQDVGGPVTVSTDTGEVFNVTVLPGGTFFGITADQPFTRLEINSPEGLWEAIDDLRVGISADTLEGADICGSARTVDPGVYAFSTIGAATDGPLGSCTQGEFPNAADVWHRFVAPSHGFVTIYTCGGADFDTSLEVFTACGGNRLACNDDFCSLLSLVEFRVEAGRSYLIRTSGYHGATGTGLLTIDHTPDCPGDFNHNGLITVQDIFDFLTAFFGRCP